MKLRSLFAFIQLLLHALAKVDRVFMRDFGLSQKFLDWWGCRDLRLNGFMSGAGSSSDPAAYLSARSTEGSAARSASTLDSQISIGDWECVSYNPKLLTSVWLFLDNQSRFRLRCVSLELKEDLEDSVSRELT